MKKDRELLLGDRTWWGMFILGGCVLEVTASACSFAAFCAGERVACRAKERFDCRLGDGDGRQTLEFTAAGLADVCSGGCQ